MLESRMMMTMPIVVEVIDPAVRVEDLEEIFAYFNYIEEKFSAFKETSELSRINRGEITAEDYSDDMKTIFALAAKAKEETNGYFDIMTPDGRYDLAGAVKGWAIYQASNILRQKGFIDFYVDAGGDIQTAGRNSQGRPWKAGIRNPFSSEPRQAIVKTLYLSGQGVATSGTYLRGRHLYSPQGKKPLTDDLVSLTVVGPDVCQADILATAAFVMGQEGIDFIARRPGFEGYLIDKNGQALMTAGFKKYTEI